MKGQFLCIASNVYSCGLFALLLFLRYVFFTQTLVKRSSPSKYPFVPPTKDILVAIKSFHFSRHSQESSKCTSESMIVPEICSRSQTHSLIHDPGRWNIPRMHTHRVPFHHRKFSSGLIICTYACLCIPYVTFISLLHCFAISRNGYARFRDAQVKVNKMRDQMN